MDQIRLCQEIREEEARAAPLTFDGVSDVWYIWSFDRGGTYSFEGDDLDVVTVFCDESVVAVMARSIRFARGWKRVNIESERSGMMALEALQLFQMWLWMCEALGAVAFCIETSIRWLMMVMSMLMAVEWSGEATSLRYGSCFL